MDLGGLTIGMREGVIVLITLVVAYIVVVLVRMLGLRRRQAAVGQPGVTPLVAEPPPASEPPADEPERESRPPAPEIRDARASQRTEEFERQRLEQEVFQLRDEVDTLRGELAALRQDMLQELAHLQAAQAVSPIYGDAMQMAAAGYDPAVIAERCGIARAEAELVVALAKSQER
ncbi:MAG: hypothetical protein CVU18_19610 [Betaproteobacteria bacterium HGW-Betaproteobacteria-12]|nr:MAG: hypothetical protein CVU18_19610 [Betaproteobacteria bacterium HGW-Betaproteobacteria-12]